MKPRVRSLDPQWIENNGQPALLLRDRLGLLDGVAVVPPPIAVLLSLCDGTRTVAELRVAFELRSGIPLAPTDLDGLLNQLDQVLLLDSPRFAAAYAAALATYRAAPFRAPALAGSAYPAEPTELTAVLAAYGDIPLSRSDHWATGRRGDGETGRRGDGASSGDAGPGSGTAPGHEQSRWTVRGADPAGTVRGVISPHIDYHRGGPIYYRVWQRAANAVRAADLVIVFGTDHLGSPGQVTLTRQHYATPFGVLPTDLDAVASVAEAVGPDFAFAEELHHRTEHSIELAAVWLHSIWRERPGKIVPILCGSFHQFIAGRQHPPFGQLIEALRAATAGRRVFVVAAADLAHVGPAFGDAMRYGPDECAHLREIDATLLETVCHGDAEAFFAVLRDEGDQRKVCGLPPIYLALRYLGGLTRERQNERDGPGATGEVVDYALCPADSNSISWVSVAGVLLR